MRTLGRKQVKSVKRLLLEPMWLMSGFDPGIEGHIWGKLGERDIGTFWVISVTFL